jgi:hypothetical protein
LGVMSTAVEGYPPTRVWGRPPAGGAHFSRPTRVWGQPRERRGYPRHGFGGSLPPTVPPNHRVATVIMRLHSRRTGRWRQCARVRRARRTQHPHNKRAQATHTGRSRGQGCCGGCCGVVAGLLQEMLQGCCRVVAGLLLAPPARRPRRPHTPSQRSACTSRSLSLPRRGARGM